MGVGQTKDGRYYVYYQFQNKQRKEYFGKSPQDKAAATQKDAFLKLLKTQGKHVFEKHIQSELQEREEFNKKEALSLTKKEYYLDELAQHYVNHIKRNDGSKNYLAHLKGFLNNQILPRYVENKVPVDDLTYLEVISWLDYCTVNNNYSSKTRANYLSYLSAIFNFGINNNLTSNNPIKGEKIKYTYKISFKLTLDDLRRIKQAASPHIAWAIEVAYETAARVGPTELFKLEWNDVDYKKNTIHIRGTKTPNSDRVIPITEKFKEKLLQVQNVGLFYGFDRYLRPILKKHPTYILYFRNKNIKYTMEEAFKSAIKRANIYYNVRPYDIRHLSISQMLANGGNLKAISEIAGHSNIKTTALYLHTLTNEKERSVNQREAL